MGTYRWPDGRVHEGMWEGNQMHGKGVLRWSDGKVYEGEFKNN